MRFDIEIPIGSFLYIGVARGYSCDNLDRTYSAFWFTFRVGKLQFEWVLSIREKETR